jgi:hypothetical protein
MVFRRLPAQRGKHLRIRARWIILSPSSVTAEKAAQHALSRYAKPLD